MSTSQISPDEIRALFSAEMSVMYKAEVPQYGTLLSLVAEINDEVLAGAPALREGLARSGELPRLSVERHGAIRVGTPEEIHVIRRMFDVMGMRPVGYYDLSTAGVPVHSTAFRPISELSLNKNPFRVFTSLLRLDLIADMSLRKQAEQILSSRRIVTPGAVRLIEKAEREGGLSQADATLFVREALETFRWHGEAIVDAELYNSLRASHPLIADVVSFRGPHINHLTPRTLEIDEAQRRMPLHGISAKESIEGPPARLHPILLRQTSFKALSEAIRFPEDDGGAVDGTHTARFGEIEQRGAALTEKGRALYDRLLAAARSDLQMRKQEGATADYAEILTSRFVEFPDNLEEMRKQKLAFFRYVAANADAIAQPGAALEELLRSGAVRAEPLTYEDFLPVSAAGIFQSNLGSRVNENYDAKSSRMAFEAAIGCPLLDELELYAEIERASLDALRMASDELALAAG